MDITRIIVTIGSFLIGAILGSFACCQVWRLRYKELGEKSLGKWSVCLNCGKRLKAAENIPIFSWLVQKGKCKSCGAKIGKAEILSELGLAVIFAGLGWILYPEVVNIMIHLTPANMIVYPILLAVFLAAIVIFWTLLIYDAKWQKLPTRLLVAANICAVVIVGLSIANMALNNTLKFDLVTYLINLAESVAILAGTYLVLYLISRERLVGSGDWLLALPVAIILNNPMLALVVLFLSNFLASIYGIFKQIKIGKKHLKIPFGPFLVIAFFIVFFLQNELSKLFLGL